MVPPTTRSEQAWLISALLGAPTWPSDLPADPAEATERLLTAAR